MADRRIIFDPRDQYVARYLQEQLNFSVQQIADGVVTPDEAAAVGIDFDELAIAISPEIPARTEQAALKAWETQIVEHHNPGVFVRDHYDEYIPTNTTLTGQRAGTLYQRIGARDLHQPLHQWHRPCPRTDPSMLSIVANMVLIGYEERHSFRHTHRSIVVGHVIPETQCSYEQQVDAFGRNNLVGVHYLDATAPTELVPHGKSVMPIERQRESFGTAFLVTIKNIRYLVTAHHVLFDHHTNRFRQDLVVRTNQGVVTLRQKQIVHQDLQRDVAIMRIAALDNLPALTLAATHQTRVTRSG